MLIIKKAAILDVNRSKWSLHTEYRASNRSREANSIGGSILMELKNMSSLGPIS